MSEDTVQKESIDSFVTEIDKPALQPASVDIWKQKYYLYDNNGVALDNDVFGTLSRVAKALSKVETKDRSMWEMRFLWALQNGAIPAGRILSNVGAERSKPATSTINCTVSATIEDSMKDILTKNLEAGLTLKAGCGIGYEFSTLRPKGAYVAGAGASTSGPLSFMEIFDKMCFTISSAGGRRGAQMATFDIHHPDVQDFIKCKREDGKLRQFNLSLLITDEFVKAVKRNENWNLSFPISENDLAQHPVDLEDPRKVVWREVPNAHSYIRNNEGMAACRIYYTLPAVKLWNLIMSSTYDFSEPGFILIDRVNQLNNNWFCENIRATNPCGEQPLPPYGSCLLGSINLCEFVNKPFTEEACFDWEKFRKLIAIFTRMLDNVVELNGLALDKQREEIYSKRRHGMGFLGLGSTLAMLRIKYGDQESLEFAERVSRELAVTGWREGVALAREKGAAPIFEAEFKVTPEMLRFRPEMEEDGIKPGDSVSTRVLFSRYSRYMQKLASIEPDIVDDIEKYGSRFTHHSSIAPTGTISLSLANNASNGIEPSFAHQYSRNIIRTGRKAKEKVDVYSYELLVYRHCVDATAGPGNLPDYFVGANGISPKQHVDVQAAAQRWIDSSISKTINVPADIPYEEFKHIYLYAYDQGLKGCTTFRFNPEVFQGVLIKEEDLSNTQYRFTLDGGDTVTLSGNDIVEYEGEQHTAANLYDALKEGYYGKL